MKVAILGTGAYGLALAMMFHENQPEIVMWTKFTDEKDMLERERCHRKVLPNVQIPEDIHFTVSMKEAVENADLIVYAVPAPFVASVSEELRLSIKDQSILIATKGIEQGSCKFMVDVIGDYIHTNRLAVLSGPTFAVDMASIVPVGLSLASKDEDTISIVKRLLVNKHLKVRVTDDIIGTEVGGAIKNVMAVASGILSGMGYPISTSAMFITEAAYDIGMLIEDLGGNKNTILSFAGLGDLLLTCTSEKSRNFTLGKMIGQGKDKEEINGYTGNTTVEGLYTLQSIYTLIQREKIDMPMIEVIKDVVEYTKKPEELVAYLMKK